MVRAEIKDLVEGIEVEGGVEVGLGVEGGEDEVLGGGEKVFGGHFPFEFRYQWRDSK